MIELTHDPIDFHTLTDAVQSPACGAVVLFLGTVREMTNGAQTLRLKYEAYPAMAEAKMLELEVEARKRWPLHEVRMVHRLGTLELGEVSIAIAVSSPHRADAFDAGRWLIDRFKEVVPIWKQEHWADGSTEWVHPGVDETKS
jgi:molybdopterin synthase catalytic subunit